MFMQVDARPGRYRFQTQRQYPVVSHTTLNTTMLQPVTKKTCDAGDIYSLKRFLRKMRTGKIPLQANLWLPMQKSDFQCMSVTKGIKHLPTVERLVIVSRGFVPIAHPRAGSPRIGGGIAWIQRLMRYNILGQSTWIAFDYMDDRHVANFGQNYDLACLKFIVDEVCHCNPQAKITLVGDCRGAHVILNYLATYHNNAVDTAILESPYCSSVQMLDTVADSFCQNIFGKQKARARFGSFINWLYPSFDRSKDTLMQRISSIKDKKIFIGHYAHDQVVNTDQITKLARAVRENNDLFLFVTDEVVADHSRLCRVPAYQRAVNAFLHQAGILCDVLYAKTGVQLCSQAYQCGQMI